MESIIEILKKFYKEHPKWFIWITLMISMTFGVWFYVTVCNHDTVGYFFMLGFISFCIWFLPFIWNKLKNRKNND